MKNFVRPRLDWGSSEGLVWILLRPRLIKDTKSIKKHWSYSIGPKKSIIYFELYPHPDFLRHVYLTFLVGMYMCNIQADRWQKRTGKRLQEHALSFGVLARASTSTRTQTHTHTHTHTHTRITRSVTAWRFFVRNVVGIVKVRCKITISRKNRWYMCSIAMRHVLTQTCVRMYMRMQRFVFASHWFV